MASRLDDDQANELALRRWWTKLISYGLLAGVVILASAMAGCPQYKVYVQRLAGEATLARAHGERQAIVTKAQAEADAAELQAKAIAIVGQAAKDYPEYRKQEFIGAFADALHNGKINQIIYVPTEAMIPILEAGKRLNKE